MRLGSNGVDRVCSLRKIPTRLHGMNFCTTLARFEPSFVRQPNGTKCTQIVRNAPKHEFRSQRGQSGVFVVKNYDVTSWHVLLHQFGPFCTEFCKAAKRSQMHPNSQDTPKYEFRVQWGGSGAFFRKIPTRLRGTNFCTSLARFALSFVTHPNYPKCIQIVQTHRIMRLGSNGVDRVRSLRKIPTRLHAMNFCTTLARFEPSFVRQPNVTKCTQIVRNAPKHEF